MKLLQKAAVFAAVAALTLSFNTAAFAYNYTVNFSTGSIEASYVGTDKQTSGSIVTFPRVTSNNSRYEFVGWAEAGQDDLITSTANVPITRDTTYVAHYGLVEGMVDYTVEYVYEDGSQAAPTVTGRAPAGVALTVGAAPANKDGYYPSEGLNQTAAALTAGMKFTFTYKQLPPNINYVYVTRNDGTTYVYNTETVTISGGTTVVGGGAGGAGAVVVGGGEGTQGGTAGGEGQNGQQGGESGVPVIPENIPQNETPQAGTPGGDVGPDAAPAQGVTTAVAVGSGCALLAALAALWAFLTKKKKEGQQEG